MLLTFFNHSVPAVGPSHLLLPPGSITSVPLLSSCGAPGGVRVIRSWLSYWNEKCRESRLGGRVLGAELPGALYAVVW